jgi:hypothetical protein
MYPMGIGSLKLEINERNLKSETFEVLPFLKRSWTGRLDLDLDLQLRFLATILQTQLNNST